MSVWLLALWSVALIAYVWFDVVDYRRFKACYDTRARQRFYARWLRQGFLAFTMGSLACLAIVGALPAVVHMPQAFFGVAGQLGSVDVGPGFFAGMGLAAVIGMLAATVIMARAAGTRLLAIGDVEALMPRNLAEYGWAALMSLNAGVGEEICFRLLLPLLLVNVLGNAAIAFAISVIVFGFVHFYQGWIGVAATALFGAAMTVTYLLTSSLLVPIAVHVLIDLRGLVIQPALAAYFRRRAPHPDR